MACLPYASCCVASYAYCLCVASYALRFVEALRRVAFRFASALRCDVASAFRFVLRCVLYCVEGVSRIALRFVEALRVACCVLRFILYCVEVVALCRVSCFVFRVSFRARCFVAMLRCFVSSLCIAFRHSVLRRCVAMSSFVVVRFVVACCAVLIYYNPIGHFP